MNTKGCIVIEIVMKALNTTNAHSPIFLMVTCECYLSACSSVILSVCQTFVSLPSTKYIDLFSNDICATST